MNYSLPCITYVIFLISSVHAIDNPHFYRATNFLFSEPRIEHNSLTSFDVTLGTGSTSHSRNSHHATVPLFDLYGTADISSLIINVPYQDTTNQYYQILENLTTITAFQDFARLSVNGTFDIIESNISYTHNISKGFLFFFHLPIRTLQIKNASFTDRSPSQNSPEWNNFLQSFTNIMDYYGINISATKETGVGDFTTLIGWTHNYQNTKVLDFLDGTIALGIMTPTGKKKNENQLFSLPLGYNGHWGLPVNVMLSLGMYEWVTLGAYAHGLFFAKNKKCLRLKTSPKQSGIIKLATGNVTAKKGAAWNTGLFLKADHFVYGLSFTAAYSYSGEQSSHLTPCDSLFDYTTINSDHSLKGWNMHTFHCLAEYDFAQQNVKTAPRIGVFYNYQITGKHVFKTNCGGGSIGLDIAWQL